MDYILRYGTETSCGNFVYEMNLIYYMYPRIMTEVNVSATVGMSATVGGNVRNSRGNVRDNVGMSTTVGEMSATVGKLYKV